MDQLNLFSDTVSPNTAVRHAAPKQPHIPATPSHPVSSKPRHAMTNNHIDTDDLTESAAIREDRLWHDNGWMARVIKNEDDDGWAVAMFKDGEAEPALVGPWTMGRDKKNPDRKSVV